MMLSRNSRISSVSSQEHGALLEHKQVPRPHLKGPVGALAYMNSTGPNFELGIQGVLACVPTLSHCPEKLPVTLVASSTLKCVP